MSRSGYCDDIEDAWRAIIWRGAVASAVRGKRGQAFLKELLCAMEGLPEHKLIAHELETEGAVCAIGAVGKARGIDMKGLNPEDTERVASTFGISNAMAREILFMNDEYMYMPETPEARYSRMRKWVEGQIRPSESKR